MFLAQSMLTKIDLENKLYQMEDKTYEQSVKHINVLNKILNFGNISISFNAILETNGNADNNCMYEIFWN